MDLPAAINNAGQVAGDCLTTDNGSGGCLWEDGQVTYFGGLSIYIGQNEEDNDVMNDAGQVIGYCPSMEYDACMWDRAHGLTDLGPGFPTAINANGDVVGYDFVWRHGVRTELDFMPAAINARGQVVGERFLWDNGVITDLGSLGGGYTDAHRINAAGQVAGVFSTLSDPYSMHAFLWDHGTMMDLGRGGSTLEHIWRPVHLNARGQVVSNDYSDESGVQGAWVWERGTRAFISSLKGPRTYVAFAFSATGFITGWYADPPCTSGSHGSCGGIERPFVSDGRTVIDLPTAVPGGNAWPLAVNSRGQVVGREGGSAVLWTR